MLEGLTTQETWLPRSTLSGQVNLGAAGSAVRPNTMSLKSLSNPSSKLIVHVGYPPVTWICPGLPVNPEWNEKAMTVPAGYGPGNGHVSVVS